MEFDYQAKKPNDLNKINHKEMGELIWWSYIFMVSPEVLMGAIEKVGNSTQKVKEYLKKPEVK
jgi:hypothetical protein